MRNSFGVGQESNSKFDFGKVGILTDFASSPDQVAIVLNENKEITAVTPVLNKATNSYEIDFTRLPSNLNVKSILDQKRKNQVNIPPISTQTLFLTVIPDYSERTRILALNGNVLALKDSELNEWLINAEMELYAGTDHHPIFETSLEDTACFINRLSNGQVSMTEVPRQSVFELKQRMNSLVGEELHNLVVETPLRCVARYFLASQPEGEDVLRSEKSREVTAFLLISGSGFSYGLWSPAVGLFSEYAFPAPNEIKAYRNYPINSKSVQNPNEVSPENERIKEHLDIYIRQAFDQLFLQLSPETLEKFELSNYAQTVWTTEPGLAEMVDWIATDYSSKTGLDFIQLQSPIDEAVAGGLLLGSFGFGENTAIGAEVLAPVNMTRDILIQADNEEFERLRIAEISEQKKHNNTIFALWAAPVLLVAVLLALVGNLIRQQIMTGIREFNADARTQELKPAVDRRKSYEANLKWYQEFIKQVSELRRQQPVGTNLLYELNSNYPLNIDESFYVSEMKLNINGGVEIKGLARNKDAVTTFLRSLEFAGGSESGQKLFSNLTYEVQEGVDMSNTSTTGQAKLPTMAGSTLSGSNPAPGIIAWNIKGNYLPAVEFAPPDPKKQPPKPNQPPANVNTPNQPPSNAPAANTAKPAA